MIAESELGIMDDFGGPSAEVDAHIDAVLEKYKRFVNPGVTRLLQFAGFGDVEVSAAATRIRLSAAMLRSPRSTLP